MMELLDYSIIGAANCLNFLTIHTIQLKPARQNILTIHTITCSTVQNCQKIATITS